MNLLLVISPTIFAYFFIETVISEVLPPTSSNLQLPKESGRNYGNSAEASNTYYSSYSGYPTYGSQTTSLNDQFNPSDYSIYYNQADNKKKPTNYPSYGGNFYPSPYSAIECHEQMMTGVIGDVLQTSGFGNFGLLRPIIAAITAAILTKIPIILAIKAILIKLIIVPIALILFSLPIILPILFLFFPLWTKLKETIYGTTTQTPVMVMMPNGTNPNPAKARTFDYGTDIFMAVIQSDRCFERLACSLGSRDANGPFIKPILWLLKFLQTMKFVQNNIDIRSTLKRYRDAYMQGVAVSKKNYDENNSASTENVCTDQMYPCNMPTLYSRPEFF